MIREAIESGDHSFLLPLSLKDVVYLEAGRKIREEEKAKLKNAELELEIQLEKQNRLLLMDIRQICFSNLYFEKDSDRIRYLNALPSNAENMTEKEKSRHVAVGHGVQIVKKKDGVPKQEAPEK